MVIKHTQLIDTFYASVVLGVAISYSQLYLFHIMLMIVLFLVTVNKKRVLKPTTKHHVFFFCNAYLVHYYNSMEYKYRVLNQILILYNYRLSYCFTINSSYGQLRKTNPSI